MARAGASLLVCAAALVALASATNPPPFAVDDKITYVSGRGVITDSANDANVFNEAIWHDASDSTNPLKINIRILEVNTAHNVAPIDSSKWITVTGASPLGAPVTTGYKVEAASKVRKTSDNSEIASNEALTTNTHIDIVITFDTTAPAGTTYKITYDCGLVKDGTAATSATASTTDCSYGPTSSANPSLKPLEVKIGWVPIFTVLRKADDDVDGDVEEDVTGQWIDLGPSTSGGSTILVPHSLKIEVTPGKTLRAGLEAADSGLDGNDVVKWPNGVTLSGATGTNTNLGTDLALVDIFLPSGSATDGSDAIYVSTKNNIFDAASSTGFAFDSTSTTFVGDEKKKFVRLDFKTLSTFEPNVYIVRLKSGAFVRSDYARSAQTTFVINAGFRLKPSFIETSGTAYDSADSWFPASRKLALKVEADNAPSGYNFAGTATPYGISSNQLFNGMTRLPGSIAVNGAPTVNSAFYQYALTTASVAPGKYEFIMAQGVVSITKTSSTTIRNARKAHTLKIGFVPDISIVEGDAPVKMSDVDERTVVTDNWLNLDKLNNKPELPHALVVKPPTGFTIDKALVEGANKFANPAAFLDTSGAGITGKIAFASTFATRKDADNADVDLLSTTYIEVAFDTVSTYTPGAYDLDIASGKFKRNDGVESCKVTLTIRAGFKPTLTFEVGSRVDKWFLNSQAVNLVVAATDLDNTVKPLYLISGKANLLSGMATLPGGTAAVAGSGIRGPATAGAITAATGKLTYPLVLTGIEPGKYDFVIANGALKKTTNSVDSRNYERKATLKVGFELDYDIVDSETKEVVASKRGSSINKGYLNPNNDHTIVFMPGTFTTSRGVVKVNTFSSGTLADLPDPATDDILCVDNACAAKLVPSTDFLAPVTSAKGTGDEGRITYKLTKLATAAAAAFSFFIPEDIFEREFTAARNVLQTVDVNIGFDIDVIFTTASTVATIDTPNPNSDFWWRGDETVNMVIKYATLDSGQTNMGFDFLFPGDKPGSCVIPGGITTATPVAGGTGHFYELKNLDKLTPGKYRFDIPAGFYRKSGAAAIRNFAKSQVLKIGFTTNIDVVDGNKDSLMSTATQTEFLSASRTKFSVRAVISRMDAAQAVTLFNNVAGGSAITAANALVADDDADSTTPCTTACPTLDNAKGSYSLTPSARYIAAFDYDTGATAEKEADYTAVQGIWCTLDDDDDDDQICNAATKPANAVTLSFAYDTTATIGTVAANNEYAATITGSNKYNIFDPDQTAVVVMPIFSPALVVKVVYDVAPSSVGYTDTVSAPAGLAEPTFAIVSADKAITLTWAKASGSATNVLTPGTYDIVILPDVVASSGIKNHRLKIRLVVGPQPVFYKLDKSTVIEPRNPGGPFATNINTVFFGLAGTDATSVKLTDLLIVQDAQGNIVTSALSIEDSSVKPASAITDLIQKEAPLWRVGLAGLTDGVYTFIVGGDDLTNTDEDIVAYNAKALSATSNNFKDFPSSFDGVAYKVNEFNGGLKIKVIIDRQAPTPKDIVFSTRVIYSGLPSGVIALNPDLFADEGTPDANLAVTVESVDDKGLALVGSKLGSATVTTSAANVRDPPGNAVIKVKATDEAGNDATALFTVPVLTRSSGTLTAIDARGVQSKTTLYSGGKDSLTQNRDAKLAGHLPLKVIVDFEVPVANVVAESLACKVGCATCTLVTSSALPKGIRLTAAPGGKRFTYEFTLDKTQVKDEAKVELKLSMTSTVSGKTTSIVSTAGSYDVIAPDAVFVVIDQVAPTPVNYIAPYRATVNSKFTLTLPSKLYYDAASDAKKIKLISSTPAAQFGLQFTADNQGNATISGIPLAQPPLASDNRVTFSIVGQDEAGNTGDPVNVVIEIHKAPTRVATFTVKGALLTYTEKDPATADDQKLSFDTGATFTAPAGTTFFAVKAYLTRPENPELVVPTCTSSCAYREEKLIADLADDVVTAVDSGADTTKSGDYAYAVDTLTGEGSIGIYYDTGLTPAMIQAWVRSLTYENKRIDVTGGTRVIRVDVWAKDDIMIGQRIDALGNTVKGTKLSGNGVVSTAARTLRVVAVNNVPTIDVTATSSWTEGGSDTTIFPSVTITDNDDNDLTAAYVSIALTASKDAYGACDKARDSLYLKTDYLNTATVKGVSPKVVGTWSPASCTLTLIPAAPLTRVTKAEMAAALKAVKYTNLDSENPVNFAELVATATGYDVNALKRQISVFIEDAANQGKLADKKRSAKVEADTINILTITAVNDAPRIDLLSIFRTGSGILSSTDKFANLATTYDADNLSLGLVKIKAFPLVLPASYDAAGKDVDNSGAANIVYQLKFDLTQVKDAAGKPVPGTFAKGQIYDPDSRTIDSLATGGVVKWVKAGSALAVEKLADQTDGFQNTFVASAVGDDGTPYSTGWTYSATEDSVLTIILKADAPTARLLRYTFRLTFETKQSSSSSVDFYVDLRQNACLDSSAGRFRTSDSSTETYIIKRKSLTAADVTSFFPYNALCAYPPTAVIAASGESYTVNRGGYADQKKSLDAALLALKNTGASIESQIAALKDLRNAARGSFTIGIPAGSLASRGSMDLTANKADASTLELLPVVTDAVETVDLDVAIKLQPAGTTFSIPVKVCLFAGDTPEGSYKVMAVAQQKDPGDPSKGYLPWEKLFDQSFNPATGEVCGFTLHFSVFAPITRPQSFSITVPKAHLMGGSCPNQCSGHGTCRQEGQCACFAGFEGYDCSMRTCPSAESWGQDQEVMHTQSECAGRGVCKRETGTCSCFDGYEGAACERATCSNDCSGHGRCRLLSELPKVQQAGYTSWEVKRLQRCLCDGGYTGGDCSLRVCPFGDDPETVCSYAKRQVQRLTLDFVTDPTATGFPDVDLSTDQFALIFTTADGKNFTTPMIDDIWEGTVHSATAISNALKTLPEFAIMDVAVSSTKGATTASALAVSYDVTFTGPTNTGNEFAMSCPYNSLGSTGCPAPGCRPKFTQLRVLKVPYMPPAVQISPLTVLQQPKPLGTHANDNTELTPGVFGVETTLVISKYTMPGTTDTVYTYKFENTKVYGQSKNFEQTAEALNILETPIPPTALRKSVAGPYGILVDFGSDTQFSIDYASTGNRVSYPIAWRLPKCSVAIVSSADKDLEKAECSNRGLCDRETGECSCFTGYAGYTCSQQTVYT